MPRHLPPLFDPGQFSFDAVEHDLLEGFEFPQVTFTPFDFGDVGGGEVEQSHLRYFERTGDYTFRLNFGAVFNDLLSAMGTHLPVDFVRNFHETTQRGVSAADLPLRFRFDFTIFEGRPYAVPVRTPVFDLTEHLEAARQHWFVPVMRALLLVLICVHFILSMFNIVFRIS